MPGKAKWNFPHCAQCILLGSDGKTDFYVCTGRNAVRVVQGTSAPAVFEAVFEDCVKLFKEGMHLDLKVRAFNQAVVQGFVPEKIARQVA